MYFKDSGIEWIGTAPSNWQIDRIKDVIPTVFGGGTPDSSEPAYWEDGSIVWITPTDFQDYENELLITNSRRKITEKGLKSCSAILLPAGAVIMASRATIGNAKIAGTELCTNQGFISFVFNKLSNKFFYYLIKAYLGDLFLNIAPGTTFKEIGRSAVKKEYIVFPGIDEQHRIAAYLDKTCAAIDTAIEKKQKQLETLDALRKSIIHKAVTSGLDDSVEFKDSGVDYLGRIPKHWTVDRLKDVANLRNTKTDVNSEAEDYLELEDIEQGTGKIISKRNTLEVESAVTLFKKGDVLFGKLRPYLEKYYLAEFDGKCTGEILAFEPIEIQRRFLLFCFASSWFIGQCNMLAYGAKMPRVNWPTQLAKINMPLPPKEEQHCIADYLNSKCAEIDSIRKNITDQISTLENYRKSLIHECVTGKRRITEEDMWVVQQY